MTEAGVRKARDMKIMLEEYVKNDLFKGKKLPHESNRRFYPKKSDLRAHINRVKLKNRYSKIDQANLIELIKKWQAENPGEKFYLRTYGQGEGAKVYDENCNSWNYIDDLKENVSSFDNLNLSFENYGGWFFSVYVLDEGISHNGNNSIDFNVSTAFTENDQKGCKRKSFIDEKDYPLRSKFKRYDKNEADKIYYQNN